MSSEKYLHKVTVGEITVHNQKIELCEYDDNWPVLFQKEAAKIFNALGTTALEIEHVGSTSVPGLCAKPIISFYCVWKTLRRKANMESSLRELVIYCAFGNQNGLNIVCSREKTPRLIYTSFRRTVKKQNE